jgi:hypothetical protein
MSCQENAESEHRGTKGRPPEKLKPESPNGGLWEAGLAAGFARQALAHEDFQEGLAADSLAAGDLTGLGDAGFGQAEGDLPGGPSGQLRNQGRSGRPRSLQLSRGGLALYVGASGRTGLPIRLLTLVLELRHLQCSLAPWTHSPRTGPKHSPGSGRRWFSSACLPPRVLSGAP